MSERPGEPTFVALGDEDSLPDALFEALAALLLSARPAAVEPPADVAAEILPIGQTWGRSASRRQRTGGK